MRKATGRALCRGRLVKLKSLRRGFRSLHVSPSRPKERFTHGEGNVEDGFFPAAEKLVRKTEVAQDLANAVRPLVEKKK